MAFVKARLFLDAQETGAICTLVFEETASNEPLERSIKSLGHLIRRKEHLPTNDPDSAGFLSASQNYSDNKLQLTMLTVQVKK